MAIEEATEKHKETVDESLPRAGEKPRTEGNGGVLTEVTEARNQEAAAVDGGLGSTDSARLARNPEGLRTLVLNMEKTHTGGGLVALGLTVAAEDAGSIKIAAEQGHAATETISNKTNEAGAEITGGTRAGGTLTGVITAYSLYNGVKELNKAVHEGKTSDAVLGTVNVGVGLTNLGISGAQILGREVPTVLETGARFGGAAVLVATAGVNIYNAKPEDRPIVAIAEGLKAGVGIGSAAIGECFATGFGLTGAAAAAAPVIVAGASVYIIDKGVERVIDDRKAYGEFEKRLDEERKPVRDDSAPAGKAPTPGDYRHLLAAERLASGDIDWSKIKGAEPPKGPIKLDLNAVLNPTPAQTKAQREAIGRVNRDIDKSLIDGGGGISERSNKDPLVSLKVDLSNPQNRKEIGRAIDLEIAKQKQILADNKSGAATYLRTSDGVLAKLSPTGGRSGDEYKAAQEKLAWLEGGKADLALYEKDLKSYQEKKAAEKAAEPALARTPSPRDSFQRAAPLRQANPPQSVAVESETVTASAKADEITLVAAPVMAADLEPEKAKPETPDSGPGNPADVRTTGSYARGVSADPDFDVDSIKPVFTAAATCQTPQTTAPALVAPTVTQRNNVSAPQV
jgi:hypothetical protein